MPDVSVVVLTVNRPDLLAVCLASLQLHAPRAEVIVVYNGTPPPTGPTWWRVEHFEENQGFAHACNVGAAAATGDLVLFLNDDTAVHEGFLEPLVAELDDPTVGMAGSKLVYPGGAVQHAGIYFDTIGDELHGFNIHEDLRTRDVVGVTAACCLVRRKQFLKLGGFDEGYQTGNEDCDLCLHYRADGYRIRYVRESVVTHHESASGVWRWGHTRENIDRFTDRWIDRREVWKW